MYTLACVLQKRICALNRGFGNGGSEGWGALSRLNGALLMFGFKAKQREGRVACLKLAGCLVIMAFSIEV